MTRLKKYQRPGWDKYFLDLVRIVGERGTCDRGRSGCVVVKDKHILTTGYVGSASGMKHCDEVGHQMNKVIHEDGSASEHCVRTIHAEQNAICQAAKFGVSLEGAILYCNMEPCAVCAKIIVNAGIKAVVAQKKYHSARETRKIFRQCRIKLTVRENQVEKYSRQ